jgi:hypothetical protein
MHVISKDSSKDGRTHTLGVTIEADGAAELVTEGQTLSAEVTSIVRTASGGIEIVAKITVGTPEPEAEANALIN